MRSIFVHCTPGGEYENIPLRGNKMTNENKVNIQSRMDTYHSKPPKLPHIEKLKTGAPAAIVGDYIYALIPVKGVGDVVKCKGKPHGTPLEEIGHDSGFFNMSSNRHTDYATFESDISERLHHRNQLAEIGRYTENSNTSTMWGKAQHVERYAKGINCYSTSGHGGFKISSKVNEEIPEYFRNKDGNYEEDCEWAKVALSFPAVFTDREINFAIDTVKNFYPDEYEKYFDVKLIEGESSKRDRQIFEKRNKDNFVVISASLEDDGMVRAIATIGGQRQQYNGPKIEEKTFLVTKEDYDTRRPSGFAIDPNKHEEVLIKDAEPSAPRM